MSNPSLNDYADTPVTFEMIKKIAEKIPEEKVYALAIQLGVDQPYRYHIDNLLESDASYDDVIKCVSFMEEVRKGTDPRKIPGLMDFMGMQPIHVRARFVTKGYAIQEALDLKDQ